MINEEKVKEIIGGMNVPYSTDEEYTNIKNSVSGYMEFFNITEPSVLNLSEMYQVALMQLKDSDRLRKREKLSADVAIEVTEAVKLAGAKDAEVTYINSDTSWDDFSECCATITFTSLWDIKSNTHISQIIHEAIENVVRPLSKNGYRYEVYNIVINEVDSAPVIKCDCEIMLDWRLIEC